MSAAVPFGATKVSIVIASPAITRRVDRPCTFLHTIQATSLTGKHSSLGRFLQSECVPPNTPSCDGRGSLDDDRTLNLLALAMGFAQVRTSSRRAMRAALTFLTSRETHTIMMGDAARQFGAANSTTTCTC